MTKKFVTTSCGDIYYFTNIIDTKRPTVLLLHGLTSNHTTWLYAMEYLAARGINTIVPDYRGHGYSDKTRKRELYRIPFMRKDIDLIMRQEGVRQVHVVGYSYGSYLAIDFAIANPAMTKSLTLISTNHVDPFSYTMVPFLGPVCYWGLQAVSFLLRWQHRKQYYYYQHKPEASFGFWKSTFKGYLTTPLSVNFWMLSESFRLGYRDSIRSIRCPTLIVHGVHDPYVRKAELEAMRDKIPGSRIVSTKSTGHFIGTNAQEEIAKILLEFVTAAS